MIDYHLLSFIIINHLLVAYPPFFSGNDHVHWLQAPDYLLVIYSLGFRTIRGAELSSTWPTVKGNSNKRGSVMGQTYVQKLLFILVDLPVMVETYVLNIFNGST